MNALEILLAIIAVSLIVQTEILRRRVKRLENLSKQLYEKQTY